MRINVYGDSHAAPFTATPQLRAAVTPLAEVEARVHVLNGATVRGMGRRDSTLRVQQTVRTDLSEHPAGVAVFAFGQVDVELGFYYRIIMKREPLSFAAFAEELAADYVEAVQALPLGSSRVVFKGVNPPVLIGLKAKAVAYTSRIITENVSGPDESRRLEAELVDIFPNDAQRTANHRRFNDALAREVGAAGFGFYDLDRLLIDPQTGLTDLRHVPAGDDHHLADTLAVRRMYWMELFDLLNGNPAA